MQLEYFTLNKISNNQINLNNKNIVKDHQLKHIMKQRLA